MDNLKSLIKNPHIQIALATGVSIITMAWVSKKRAAAEPIHNLMLAVPPFIAAIYEALLGRNKKSRLMTTWYWIVAVLLSSTLIILFHVA